MTPIRVVIVDDHMVFREGLRALLGRVDDIEIVGEAATTQEATEVAEALLPDVVLMDLHLPGGGGDVATTSIIAAHPQVAVLVLTMHSDDAHLRHALTAGARGYLLKDAEPDAIIRAIVAVNEGQAIFDRGIAARVIAATGAPQAERPFPALTEREHEILDRLARGLRNDAIAARMGISVKTVQNNVSTILLKLGATDRAQAVALARDAGLGRRI
ncbi:MAG TPA: response regulator transcription factor [Mycobacterium sp.]|nr:response regulator transcription factor [Propionibacteriaceae bacterium]HET9564226.1 response regulator transcription factor [Mycobacterium sp.]